MFDVNEMKMEIVQGDTLTFAFTFEDADADAEEIILDDAKFSVRETLTCAILAQAALDDGIIKTDVGTYTVRLAPSQTILLEPGRYYYDLQISVNNDVFTLITGLMDVIPSVTEGVNPNV